MKDKNDWITQGIKISCKHKEVFTLSLRMAMIQKQKYIVLNIVKSYEKSYKKLRSNTTVDLQQNLITK